MSKDETKNQRHQTNKKGPNRVGPMSIIGFSDSHWSVCSTSPSPSCGHRILSWQAGRVWEGVHHPSYGEQTPDRSYLSLSGVRGCRVSRPVGSRVRKVRVRSKVF